MGSLMRFIQLITIMMTAMTILASEAFACGGQDFADEQIIANTELIAIQNQIQDTYQQQIKVESIVRSNNELLNLDKQVVVAAMCAANYIQVYFQTEIASDLLCMTTFELNARGEFVYNGLLARIICRQSVGAQLEVIEISKK